MCGSKKAPTQATVDPAAERQKAADEAAQKANQTLVMDSRRKRGQRGLLSADDAAGGSVLARASNSGIKPMANTVMQKLFGRVG